MPNLERGHAALHADDAARAFGHQGGRTAADAGPDHQVVPRGGVGLRQGRPRRDRDRSGADRDVRDHHQPEAEGRMAAGRDASTASWPRWTRRCSFPASPTPGPCRSRRASTCSRPASARRSASRCSAPTWPRWNGSREQVEQVLQDGARHVQRLRRARHRRLLPRHRARPRRRSARYGLMIQRRAGRDRDRARRPDRHHHGRGPRALHRQHALSARPAQRPAGHRHATCWCRCRRAARCRWAKSPRSSSTRGPTSIRTENGQLAVYIFVDIRDRDLGGYVADAQAGRRTPASSSRPAPIVMWSGQFEYLQRAEARLKIVVPVTLADHLPAALSQLPRADRDADRHAVAAVRAGRRALADVVARLQPVGRRRGRLHRAGRRRRRDRRRDADLPRSCARRSCRRAGRPRAAR